MDFKEALLLMADRTRFVQESDLLEVKTAISDALTVPEPLADVVPLNADADDTNQ